MTSQQEPQTVFERSIRALNELDYDAFEALLTDDLTLEFPQSGERFRGARNVRASFENYPGGLPASGLDMSEGKSVAPRPRSTRTPTFTFVRAQDSGNVGTAAYKAHYPDRSVWWCVTFYELRDGRIARLTTFFAPLFEATDWRKPYVDSAGQRA